MMKINDTYINALLADSSYVNGLLPNQTGAALTAQISGRMTPELAKYIGDNFTVVTQVSGLASSFDAVVWRGNAGTPYGGQIYVSMRGTQEPADLDADADLAASGLAHDQLADMVNWWLRATTPSGQMAKQVTISTTFIPGSLLTLKDFVAAPSVQGTGELVGLGAITSVNGHSLGGYLATSFARLFGGQWPIAAINTFNSAGFSRAASANIESGFNELAQLIGSGIGLGGFSSAQNNYFAENGINVTTNTWNPVGFRQYGTRIGLFQEALTPDGINNHYMYKLTDLLSLGNALEKLDPAMTLSKLSALASVGSNQTEASYEGILDGVRRLIFGTAVAPTLVGDSNVGNPQPASRLDYQANIAALRNSDAFNALVGKVHIDISSGDFRNKAQTDFGALAALTTLSPLWISGNGVDDAPLTALWTSPAWSSTYGLWQADQTLSASDREAGKATFTDQWIADRSSLLDALERYNMVDASGSLINSTGSTSNAKNVYVDVDSARTLTEGLNGLPARYIKFGGAADDTLLGEIMDDHLYGGDGDDTLKGQMGDDYLEGDSGNDTLIGGTGDDTLIGGSGDDTYIFATGDGRDTVADGIGQDIIQFDGATLSGGKQTSLGTWAGQEATARPTSTPCSTKAMATSNLVITRIGDNSRQHHRARLAVRPDGHHAERGRPVERARRRPDGQRQRPQPPSQQRRRPVADYTSAAPTCKSTAPLVDDLYGGTGDDVIEGSGGGDLLLGHDGNDRLYGDTVIAPDAAVAAAQSALSSRHHRRARRRPRRRPAHRRNRRQQLSVRRRR